MVPRLPISVLEHNIVGQFEALAAANGYPLAAGVDCARVCGEIQLICDPILPRGPYVDYEERKIYLYESHLGFLWAYIYSAFVIYEVGVQAPMMAGSFDGVIRYNSKLMARARMLQCWVYRFASTYEPWDQKELPNPAKPANEEEEFYVTRANALYVQAVSVLLMHEYAHLVQGHVPGGDRIWSLAQEKEADQFALRFLIGGSNTPAAKQISAMAATLLFTSCLLLVKDIGSIWQNNHPNLHDRVANALSAVALEEQHSEDYVYYLAGNMLRDHANWLGADIGAGTYETAYEFFYSTLDHIDKHIDDAT